MVHRQGLGKRAEVRDRRDTGVGWVIPNRIEALAEGDVVTDGMLTSSESGQRFDPQRLGVPGDAVPDVKAGRFCRSIAGRAERKQHGRRTEHKDLLETVHGTVERSGEYVQTKRPIQQVRPRVPPTPPNAWSSSQHNRPGLISDRVPNEFGRFDRESYRRPEIIGRGRCGSAIAGAGRKRAIISAALVSLLPFRGPNFLK
jgi:hypothetical protein